MIVQTPDERAKGLLLLAERDGWTQDDLTLRWRSAGLPGVGPRLPYPRRSWLWKFVHVHPRRHWLLQFAWDLCHPTPDPPRKLRSRRQAVRRYSR